MTVNIMPKGSTYVNISDMPRRPAPSACCAPASGTAMPCCPPISKGALSAADARSLADALKVVADPARVRLLSLLQAQPGGEACVCHLIEPLKLGQPTVTHHLQVLHRAGFLTRERRGVWVYYRVVPSRLAAVRRALT